VKGSSWGERVARQEDDEARQEFRRSFLEKVGAKATSKDVHWPMTLDLRVPVFNADGVQLRSSGFRQRSGTSEAARRAKKMARGYITGAPQGNAAAQTAAETGYGRSSGSWEGGQWALGGWEAGAGRSSGSAASGSGSWTWGSWWSQGGNQ
jgi:hypothetical protein